MSLCHLWGDMQKTEQHSTGGECHLWGDIRKMEQHSTGGESMSPVGGYMEDGTAPY